MSDIHVTRELLRAVARGELSERALAQIEAEHLASLCPFCRREILAWRREEAGGSDPVLASRILPAVLGRHSPDLAEGERRAERDLRDLLAASPEERPGLIARARSRFRGAVLAERLLQESRRRIPGDPREALHLAELARAVIHRSPETPDTFDLLALSFARMANAHRASGDLLQAEEHFRFARHLVRSEGVTDPRVLAQIDDLEGSLRKDQRRFAEAENLLSRAAMLYRINGSEIETARVLLKLGSMFFHQGLLERAIEMARTALEWISPEAQPRLYLMGRHNLSDYLAEAGRFVEAAGLVAADEELYRRFPEPWTQLRLSWLRGKIAAGLGDAPEAERLFLETRDGFIRQGIGYDVAMVSLDLALLYLKEGRASEIRRLAEETVALFEAQEVHREALAALLLLRQAARREEVTAALIREVAERLSAAAPPLDSRCHKE